MASHLLIANHIRTTNVRTAAIYLERPALGSAWTPIVPKPNIARSTATMKAWCAFLNSTCGSLLLLNARAKTLTYSIYKPAQIGALPLPDPAKCDLTPLEDAFHKLEDAELLPWPRMGERKEKCPARAELDAAAATVLDIDPAEVADWRQRIAREPTVCNRHPYPRITSEFLAFLMSGPSFEGLNIERDRSPMRDVEL